MEVLLIREELMSISRDGALVGIKQSQEELVEIDD